MCIKLDTQVVKHQIEFRPPGALHDLRMNLDVIANCKTALSGSMNRYSVNIILQLMGNTHESFRLIDRFGRRKLVRGLLIRVYSS